MYQIKAFYKFTSLEKTDLLTIQDSLNRLAADTQTCGLIVLGKEGYNGTIAGAEPGITRFIESLNSYLDFSEVLIKESTAPFQPFKRFKAEIRNEIITLTKPEHTRPLIEPPTTSSTHLSAEAWHRLLESEEDFLLVDTRNEYETALGTFKNSLIPPLQKFSDFPEYIAQKDIPKDKKLLLFCTGGIRCEKAVPELKRQGYHNVFQLEGGILKYLEEFPNAHYEGECFVFDQRVALDQDLCPSKQWKLCPHCGNPGSIRIECSMCGKNGNVCENCARFSNIREKTCSKNCHEHLKRTHNSE
jgi:UPF0176 protein